MIRVENVEREMWFPECGAGQETGFENSAVGNDDGQLLAPATRIPRP